MLFTCCAALTLGGSRSLGLRAEDERLWLLAHHRLVERLIQNARFTCFAILWFSSQRESFRLGVPALFNSASTKHVHAFAVFQLPAGQIEKTYAEEHRVLEVMEHAFVEGNEAAAFFALLGIVPLPLLGTDLVGNPVWHECTDNLQNVIQMLLALL